MLHCYSLLPLSTPSGNEMAAIISHRTVFSLSVVDSTVSVLLYSSNATSHPNIVIESLTVEKSGGNGVYMLPQEHIKPKILHPHDIGSDIVFRLVSDNGLNTAGVCISTIPFAL